MVHDQVCRHALLTVACTHLHDPSSLLAQYRKEVKQHPVFLELENSRNPTSLRESTGLLLPRVERQKLLSKICEDFEFKVHLQFPIDEESSDSSESALQAGFRREVLP